MTRLTISEHGASRWGWLANRLRSCRASYVGVALMENFDVKTRRSHSDTSAMQRVEVDLAAFGATDFSEA